MEGSGQANRPLCYGGSVSPAFIATRWSKVEVIDGEEVIADFYGGETKHGLELRLHSGSSVED